MSRVCLEGKRLTGVVGNFGTVFLDNGYYNKAIAASPVHAFPGYVMGGVSSSSFPTTTHY